MTTRRRSRNQARTSFGTERAPLIEHLQELKRRLFYVAVSIAGVSGVAFWQEQRVIDLLLRPSHGQHFIYTSPMGGVNFLFSVCLYLGAIASLPIIFYQLLKFIHPLMRDTTARFIGWGSAISGVIAVGGIVFGYFVGLPAALNFLVHQFHNSQVQALLTIQSYLTFVMAYMLGSALMFQLPLVLLFLNRIKPLKPQKLFKYERFVILFAIIFGFIMNPSPNLAAQMIVVVPFILMYQVGIGLIWFVNRGRHSEKFYSMLDHDTQIRTERLAKAHSLQLAVDDAPLPRATARTSSAKQASATEPFAKVIASAQQPAADSTPTPAASLASLPPRRMYNDVVRPAPARVYQRSIIE